MTDLEIAKKAKLWPIEKVAEELGLSLGAWEPYGRYKAKVNPLQIQTNRQGKLVLVTAINPTPAGEGKTTVSVGLADALRLIGKKAVLALREPSLGPVFGMKGGAAGGGYSQVAPMEDLNLHFTGDLHAITSANNLLAAMIDNHIHQGNALGIDPRAISFRRCMDMNDRQLRQMVNGLGGKANGSPREDGFDITAASEVMAAFCLSSDIFDLRERMGRIVVGKSFSGEPITAAQIGANGAMAALLQAALRPNLVQTLAHTPALIHGGPFANIAHGCNSVVATRLAMRLGDICVTEAGFGADLGAEKFLDIKCRLNGLAPSCAVVVATVRALNHHGGTANLLRHVSNLREVFGLPVVVAVNRFSSDTDDEIAAIISACAEVGAKAFPCDIWAKGGEGGLDLARAVAALCEGDAPALRYAYPLEGTYDEKLFALAKSVYGADGVEFAPGVRQALRSMPKGLPICVAKTQYSFSDDPKKLGAPKGFTINVRQVRLSAGAGFVVAFTGEIIAMPGLPKRPAAQDIDISPDGELIGIF